jgi:NAD(P)-dependent dehydrogenase (short-subunit alcohol dehydrogenase family)
VQFLGEDGFMAKQLDGRVAIVTGTSSGIGKAIAEMFAAEGAKVVLAARRKPILDEIASGIKAKGGTALAVATDVTQEAEVAALFAKAVEAFGRVDVVINNAGVPSHAAIEDMTLKQWTDVVDVNLTAPFLVAREAVRVMKTQKPQGGRIVNVGSVSAKTPRPDSIAYTATKYALQGLTHQLTMDGRKYGVVSSIVHPGATLSSFSAKRGRTVAGHGKPGDDYIMSADDVARVALLMSSLPDEVNLYEATILPNQMRSFIGRG